jgi:hypothetical protein
VTAIVYVALGVLAGLVGAVVLLRAIYRPGPRKVLEIGIFCIAFSAVALALSGGSLAALGLAWVVAAVLGLTLTTAITTARGKGADR